jgi:transposase-like protein
MIWTAERQRLLETRAAQGKSFQDVADEFGTTRNAIAGRARRTKVTFSGPLKGGVGRYDYEPSFRARVLARARRTSQIEAARFFGVHPQTVYRWMAA